MAYEPPPIQPVEDAGVSSWTVSSSGFSGPGFQFGVFEVDTKTGELRKEGRLVHLRNQPFLVLTNLLERAGDLVTREEMKAALWADDVDVDVEQGLNYCVKEIRSALGDSAESPRFIQTLPRRGYRFLGEVRRVGPGGAKPAEARPGEADPARTAGPSEAQGSVARSSPVAVWRWRGAVVGALAVALLAAVFAWRASERSRSPAVGSERERLVVLPFADLSAQAEGYLADGLTDELIGSLGRITQGRLSVLARSTSLAYRLREQDAAAFARELGASYFIEGTVRREQQSARVSVTLARASDGTQLWSETYDRSIGDLLRLEGEVAAAIAAGVKVAVSAEARGSAAIDSEAYLEYLKGRFLWNKRSRESLFESLRTFERLVASSPEFALGFAGLADAYVVLMDHGHLSPKESWLRARAAAERAVALDPGLAEAWTTLGMIRGLYEWNSTAAHDAFVRAAELNPSYSTRLHWQAILLRAEGREAEALKNLEAARELDPLSLVVRSNLAALLVDMGKGPEGLSEAESIVSVSPSWPPGLLRLAEVLARLGRREDARVAYLKAAASGSPAARAELAAFHSLTGRADLAAEVLRDLEKQAQSSYVAPFLLAKAWTGIDKERAFSALEAAIEERSPYLRFLRRDPDFEALRGELRFGQIVRVLWPTPLPTVDE